MSIDLKQCHKCLGELPYVGGVIPTTTCVSCGNCDCYSCLVQRIKDGSTKGVILRSLKIGEQRGRDAGYQSGYDAAMAVMIEHFRSHNYWQTVVEIERFVEDVKAAGVSG